MRTKVRAVVAASVVSFALIPAHINASTVIYGPGLGHDCSVRALMGKADGQTIEICTNALTSETMSDIDYARTLVNRGVVQLRRASLDAAASDFDKAQKIAANLPEIYVNRGVVLLKREQYGPAIEQIDKGIALGVEQMNKAYYDRAMAKEALGDIKGAYFDYAKASELSPDWEAPKKELLRFNVQKAGA